MTEIEITTTGELKLAGDVVGHITWTRPYVARDVAGVFAFDGCAGCECRDDEIAKLKRNAEAAKKRTAKLTLRIAELEAAAK